MPSLAEPSAQLLATLQDDAKRADFQNFLGTQAGEGAAVLRFWSDVRAFKACHADVEQRGKSAGELYRRFLADETGPDSLVALLPHDVRGTLVNQVLREDLSATAFDDAVRLVLIVLERHVANWAAESTQKAKLVRSTTPPSPRPAALPNSAPPARPAAPPSPAPSLVLLARPPADLLLDDELLGGSDDELLNRADNLDDLLNE